MSSAAAAELKEFFEQIWGDTEGYVYLPVKEGGRVRKFFLRWPEKADSAVRHILKYAAQDGCEVFYSPALYSRMSARHEHVLGSHVAWADFDGNFPEAWPKDIAPVPSIEVQSSTSTKRHVYWRLDEFTEPKRLEKINRSLAYALGADLSGWDANQFLRPPYSVNRKYRKPIVAKIVADRTEISPRSLSAFDHLPAPAEAIKQEIDLEGVPSIEEVKTLASWDEDLLELFHHPGKKDDDTFDRSGALQRIAYKGAELGWTDEQIMAALLDADERWDKYRTRPKQSEILIGLINRSRAKIGYEVVSDKKLLSNLLRTESTPEEADAESDFFSVSQLNAIPGIDNWMVEGLLTPTGIGLITGRPGTGKTQLGFQLAADLATGRDSFLMFPLSGRPVKVLFLSLEMGKHQLGHFTVPLARVYQDPILEHNLVIYGKGEPVAMNREDGQNLFLQMLDDYRPDVVIADSLSHMSSSDVKSDDDMKALFEFLGHCRSRYSFGMVIVHHHRKKANDASSRKQANSQDDIYGSFYIAANIDFALDLEDRNDPNQFLDLNLLKARFRVKFEDARKLIRDESLHFTEADGGDDFHHRLTGPDGKDPHAPHLSV